MGEIDRASDYSDTHREVGARRIGAGDARTVVIRRRYAAAVQAVWDACTEPERVNRWFLPLSGDLREGGTFSLEGNASGEILRCTSPRLLAVSWAYGDRPVDEVVLRLTAVDAGATMLELDHATVSGEVEWDGQMVDVLPDVGTNWELALTYLTKYLRGELPDAPAVEWFVPTPEDEALMNRSGQAWKELISSDER